MDAVTLRSAMLDRITLDHARAMVPHFNAALLAASCTTVNRAAMMAAQIGHESASLRYMEEIASGAAYEGRKDLGNTQPGDGRRFKGRGPIQLTGRDGYGQFSRWCHARGLVSSPTWFVDRPAEVALPRWGFLAASHYWVVRRPKINAQCDAGALEAVTRSINGGLNGIADRRMRWEHCLKLGTRLLPDTSSTPAPAPPAPGGIETMAFGDRFTDWAGNGQTVKGWMDNNDRRGAGIFDWLFKPSLRSRVDGQVYTPGTFIEATHGDVNELRGRVLDVERKLDLILEALAKRS